MLSMPRQISATILLAAAGWVTVAFATADGPDFYAVTGITAEDVLILRSAPADDAEPIATIPHNAHGLQNLGCQGLPSVGEWTQMTKNQRDESRRHYWCKVNYQGAEGWVAGRFLREDSDTAACRECRPQ